MFPNDTSTTAEKDADHLAKEKLFRDLYRMGQDYDSDSDDDDDIDGGASSSIPPPTVGSADERQRAEDLQRDTPEKENATLSALPTAFTVNNPGAVLMSHSLDTPKNDSVRKRPSTSARRKAMLDLTEDCVKETPIPGRASNESRVLSPSTSDSPMPKESSSKVGKVGNVKGRKRAKTVMVPEGQRVFKDLVFFYVPNNDTNGVRRMKILKAKEYGATWAREWQENVTHIIADSNVTHAHLLTYFNPPVLPTGVTVVNELYPPDCVSYSFLVNPNQKRYLVQGATIRDEQKDQSLTSTPDSSLPLKQAGPSVRTREISTPSSSAGSKPLPNAQQKLRERASDESASEATRQNAPQYHDDLSEVIVATKRLDYLQHLELEEDEGTHDNELLNTFNVDTADDDDDESMAAMKRRKKNDWQEHFQCMKKHDGRPKSDNPNARTVEILEQMSKHYDLTRDQWRSFAYRKAIATLRKQQTLISTAEEASRIKGIGARLAAKIEEIVWTDRLRRLESALDDPREKVLIDFMKIYGVGLSQATKWVDAGYRTREDLVRSVKLTENQKIGIEHYDDFQARIPRTEVATHGAIVSKAIQQIDPDFEVMVMGSYRRGASNSGDIDLIITKEDATIEYIRDTVLDRLVPLLFDQDFLKVALASTHKDDGSKWHGACQLPSSYEVMNLIPPQSEKGKQPENPRPWRRIDLLLVPPEELGAAFIYFTGNDIFNRSMRLLASRKGLRLNQRGLYKNVIRGQNRVKLTDGERVAGRTEQEIFDYLGVPWRPPEHRIP